MRVSKVLLAYAAASMVAMPVAAGAATVNPAAKLSISKEVRASSKSGKSKAAGTGIIILILGAAAVAGGIVAATSGDSTPDSN